MTMGVLFTELISSYTLLGQQFVCVLAIFSRSAVHEWNARNWWRDSSGGKAMLSINNS